MKVRRVLVDRMSYYVAKLYNVTALVFWSVGICAAGCFLLSLSSACTQSAIGIVSDGGTVKDSQMDTGVPLDVEDFPDGSPGCDIPEEMTIIENPTEPSFVMEIEQTIGGHYVLGGAQGWQNLTAGLWLLASHDLSVMDSIGVDGEMVFPSIKDQATIWTVTVKDNEVSLHHYEMVVEFMSEVSIGGFLGSVSICNECVPAWQGPVYFGGKFYVATRSFGDQHVTLTGVDVANGSIGDIENIDVFPGSDPWLAADEEHLYLVYLLDNAVRFLAFDETGAQVGEEHTLEPASAVGVLGVTEAMEGGAWVAFSSHDEDMNLEFNLGKANINGQIDPWIVMDTSLGGGFHVSMTESRSLLGISWGEIYGQGRVGAHFMALEAYDTSLLTEDTLLSPPIGRSSVSHSIWSAIAPHRKGFVTVWGGWNEETNHGIYGKILKCNSAYIF